MVPLMKLVQANAIAGYVGGLIQPPVAARLMLPEEGDYADLVHRLRLTLLPHLPPERPEVRPAAAEADQRSQLGFEVSIAVAGIQEAVGLPVACAARVRLLPQGPAGAAGQRMLQLLLPTLAPKAALAALQWVLEILNALAADSKQNALSAGQIDSLQSMITGLLPMALPGVNNRRFLSAAYELGIPVLLLPGSVFQFGWGQYGRLFRSSITDETPSIAVTLAKNKVLTNAILRMAALPVPPGQIAADEMAAVAIGDRLGYPVVVKPADLDQGVGVAAGLRTAEEVRAAFHQAVRHSRNVLVEKHIPGTAFRILVFRGQSVAVVQRRPAGVTGDGNATVETLVAETNKDPRRSLNHFSNMKPIVIDDEAIAILAELGMNLASVPDAGQFVALKRAANVSTGGDVLVHDPKNAHPGCLALAERAAKVLRLDVAGVDLVTLDIQKSPFEAAAAILEVNAQPQMGLVLKHIHAQLLQLYVRGRGTIPTAFVLGAGKAAVVQCVRERCAESGLRIGTVAADGLFVGAGRVAAHPGNELGAVNALLVDPEVSALLLATDGHDFHSRGIPVPFFDSLFIANWQGAPEELKSILILLRPHLRGALVLDPASPHWQTATRIFGNSRVRPISSLPAMAEALDQFLSADQAP